MSKSWMATAGTMPRMWMMVLLGLSSMTTGVSGQGSSNNVPCNICGTNGVVGDLFAVYESKFCEDWNLRGESGNLNSTMCNSANLRDTCVCGTASPTSAPTGLVELETQLVLVLLNVTNELSPSIQADYEELLATFYDKYFQQISDWPGIVQDWTVILDYQDVLTITNQRQRRQLENVNVRRRLPSQLVPLETRLNISARASQTLGMDVFAAQIKRTTINRQGELQDLLKDADSVVTAVFFKQVNETEAFAIDEPMTVPRVPVVSDAGSLTPPPADSNGSDNSALSTGAIAGIAAAAGFILILTFGMWYVYCRSAKTKEVEQELEDHKQSVARESQTMRYSHATRGFESPPGGTTSMRASTAESTPQARDGGSIASATASTRYRSQQLGNLRSSSTRIVSPDGKTLSVLSGESSRQFSVSMREKSMRASESAPPLKNNASSYSPAPNFQDEIQEGDNEDDEEYDENNNKAQMNVNNEQDALMRNNEEEPHDEESYEEDTYEDSQQDNYQDPPVMQQQQQQQQAPTAVVQQSQRQQSPAAQRESLPPPVLAAQIPTTNTPALMTRDVLAPPGKLGIVIETTLEGPVVHKINANSPLMGSVFEGDLITAIDGIDCRAMSASAITALMVRTAESQRRMTIRSEH